jgi:hypothetical protein
MKSDAYPLDDVLETILEADADPIAADDPRYPVPEPYPTPQLLAGAAEWPAGIEASARRLGMTRAEYLALSDPIPPRTWPPGPSGDLAPAAPPVFPEPEDRGTATLSALGDVEYVEDLIRPGRIVVWAAEEGAGKSYAVGGELAIRVAAAGGLFAGTWPVVRTGPVLDMSEMHPDDDYVRETTVLASLGLDRSALIGCYFRLPLMTAAGGKPALTVPEWCAWITGWLRGRAALLLIVDTATAATQVDPWGTAIQAVYTALRVMLAEYPALAIILVVHVKKPQGRGERRLSDVLGEWGRWCDVVVLQENDGASLERARLTVRKRVRHERRIVATKRGGLLVDPTEPTVGGRKVDNAACRATFLTNDVWTAAEFAKAIGVTKPTAVKYLDALDGVDSATVDGTQTWFSKETT